MLRAKPALVVLSLAALTSVVAWLSNHDSELDSRASKAAIWTPAPTVETTKICDGVEVQSLVVSAEYDPKILGKSTPEIKLVSSHAENSSSTSARAATAFAFGPILGSMDSHSMKPEIA